MRWTLLALLLLVAGSTVLLVHSPGLARDDGASRNQAMPPVTPWYLGAITTRNVTAEEIDAEFYVPQQMPRVADVYYPLIVSAYDSNSSYDQIGILAEYGKWMATTSSTHVNGTTTVYDSQVWSELPSGYYWFRMAISEGVVTYTVATENESVILTETARTGGGYFVLSPSFFDRYTFNTYPGFTVFEEVYNAIGGRPALNLLCRRSYFVSNETRFESSWSSYRWGSSPPGLSVSIDGSSVMIENVSPTVTLAAGRSSYYTKEPIALSADAVGTVGDVTYRWYVDGALTATTAGPGFNLTLSVASLHRLEVQAEDAVETLTSNDLELEVTKISLSVLSARGTVTGAGLYDFGDLATVAVSPTAVSTGAGSRVSFSRWRSDSPDGYAGSNSSFAIALGHNMTEVATWTNQSLVSFRSNPASLDQDVWYDCGQENITLPAVWSNDSSQRMSLTGFSVDGIYSPTGRKGWVLSTDLEGPMTVTLSGVEQYSVILKAYDGPYNSTSQTGDLWFDAGSDAVVSVPSNFTEGLMRSIFTGWGEGATTINNSTVSFPAIDSSHTITPEFRPQYFVYIAGNLPSSPVPVALTTGPPSLMNSFGGIAGSSGAWFDAGGLVPTALESWSQPGVSDSRLVLSEVVVSFLSNASVSQGISVCFNSVCYNLFANSMMYDTIGGALNASSGRYAGLGGIAVNGTVVTPTLPSSEMPKIIGGQLEVDRPFYLSYVYTPEFYFNLTTPFGGFHEWMTQSGSLFSYSAPVLAGFLGTQRFAGWVGTVNSTSPTLDLFSSKPYTETAHYVMDYGAVASILVAAASLVVGGYVLLSRRYVYSGKGSTERRDRGSHSGTGRELSDTSPARISLEPE